MSSAMPKYAFFQRKLVPIADAKVSIMTHSFNYGTGVFEGIRAYWNDEHKQLYVFQLREHYLRFLNSCKTLMIELPYAADDLCALTLDLLQHEAYQTDTYLRPLAYKSSAGIGVKLHDLENDFSLFAMPYGKYIENQGGLKVAVSSWRRVDDNVIPARAKIVGSYVNSALAKSEAMLNGFDEAIVLTHDGHVSEGSAENLWMIKDGKAITPSVSDNVLEGITRNVVAELLQEEMGVEVVERSVDRTELYQAEEMFFCGTGVEIALISEVDRRKVGQGVPGPIGKKVQQLYFDAVRGKLPKYMRWCTPVYAQAAAVPVMERSKAGV
jgi:branched-chain amino acid aminotransferase